VLYTSQSLLAYAIVTLFSLFLIISACDSSTLPKTATLTGRIVLVNDTGNIEYDIDDCSGIRVALYELVAVDTALAHIREQYTNVGFSLNQNSEFDHYDRQVVLSTESREDGTFELSNVPNGVFNLVVEKTGWGFRYVYDLSVKHDVSLTDSIYLYPEKHLSGAWNGDYVIEDWHHIVADNDLIFLSDSSLKIGSNGFLRIANNARVDVHGTLEAQGEAGSMFHVLADNVGASRVTGNSTQFNSLVMQPTANIVDGAISWGRFKGGVRTIGLNDIDEVLVKNCRMVSSSEGININQSSGINLENNVFSTFEGSINNIGVNAFSASGFTMKNCVLSGMKKGIEVYNGGVNNYHNNALVNMDSAMGLYDTQAFVKNNLLRAKELGLRVAGTNTSLVEYNQIEAKVCIAIGYSGYYYGSLPSIQRNNLLCESYYIRVVPPNSGIIEAKNNYFYSVDAQHIESKIYHKPDYPEEAQNTVAVVEYLPFLSTKVQTAGITQ